MRYDEPRRQRQNHDHGQRKADERQRETPDPATVAVVINDQNCLLSKAMGPSHRAFYLFDEVTDVAAQCMRPGLKHRPSENLRIHHCTPCVKGQHMIQSKSDLHRYLEADLRNAGISRWRPWLGLRYPLLRYQRLLRKTEYAVNCTRGPLAKPYAFLRQYLLRRAGIRLGFTIHPNIFGPGLSIAHWGTIVINPNARIGANCRIHPGTSIGETNGGSPKLGDGCYIGPGAKLFGPIILGDRVKIGANAVVNKSFPADVSLAGVPARIVQSGTQMAISDKL